MKVFVLLSCKTNNLCIDYNLFIIYSSHFEKVKIAFLIIRQNVIATKYVSLY